MADKTLHAREASKVCHRELVELENLAGIGDAADGIRSALPAYEQVYHLDHFSDESKQAHADLAARHQKRMDKQIRDLYFSVQDLDLRKAIIEKVREQDSLALDYWNQELHTAREAARMAKFSHDGWWLPSSLYGVMFVAVGSTWFGIPGALGGLLVGYFNGRRLEAKAVLARDQLTQEAQAEAEEAEVTWNRVRNEPSTFSHWEAYTGQPGEALA